MSNPCSPITFNMVPLLYASAMSLAFIAIRYMIAVSSNDENGKYAAKFMLGDFILAFVVVVTFSIMVEHITTETGTSNLGNLIIDGLLGEAGADNSNYVPNKDSQTLICNSFEYLANLSANSMELYKAEMWVVMNLEQLSSYTLMYNPTRYFPGTINIQHRFLPMNALGSVWAQDISGKAGFILQAAVFPTISQFFILSLFTSPHIAALLSLIVVFRTLPFFKGFANLVFALVITMLLIFPLVVYGESYIFQPPIKAEIRGITSFWDQLNGFSLVLSDAREEAATLSYLVLSNLGKDQPVKDSAEDRFNLDGTTLSLGKAEFTIASLDYTTQTLLDYKKLTELNSDMAVKVAFLSTINLLVVVVSIRTLEIMLGDTDGLIEMFFRWV